MTVVSGFLPPTAYNYDSDLDVIRTDVAKETRQREEAIHDILERLNNINVQDQTDITSLETAVAQLQQKVAAIPEYDLRPYQTKVKAEEADLALHRRIDGIVIPDVTPYAREAEVNQELVTATSADQSSTFYD